MINSKHLQKGGLLCLLMFQGYSLGGERQTLGNTHLVTSAIFFIVSFYNIKSDMQFGPFKCQNAI